MMNEEVEQNEEDNNHHNEVEEKNNGDITEGTSKKRTRGQTSCQKIHARSIEEREEVILNDDGQSTGPREKIVKDLSLFLDEGKKWVESIVQDAWRRYKCKIKKLHFEKFVHMTERLKHRPATIPESHFKKLCLYWSNENVKKIGKSNKKNRATQKWRHRMGSTSFAVVRQRLSQLKDHLTQNPEQNHTEAFKEVFGKEKAGRVRCYGRNVTPTALKQKEKQNQIMDSMKSFPSEANNAQNVEGQSNEHSTTHASSPDKGQLSEKDSSFYEAH
ncbi:putative transposase, Ptta/En/Spm, plant [Senna tora]|uniref:Putative transposase, Ptta/En/Spm, plant n=1 Tax=Senna tora TaxID=362788 RepID=A0A834XEK3_9FABA|nr:putative transposase, Ptta/En/Spm, plant [Senna tora]